MNQNDDGAPPDRSKRLKLTHDDHQTGASKSSSSSSPSSTTTSHERPMTADDDGGGMLTDDATGLRYEEWTGDDDEGGGGAALDRTSSSAAAADTETHLVYGDLDAKFQSLAGEALTEQLHQSQQRVAELGGVVREKDAKLRRVTDQVAILIVNISSLYHTAKSEMERKDALIRQLQSELNLLKSQSR